MSYTQKRYLTYTLITLSVLLIPFVKINGNHLLLLSFEKLQFHFIGISFSVNELYVMPFLLIALFIGIFAITSILGRFWCGWGCPQTIFRVIYRDLIEGSLLDLRKIKNKQKSIDLYKGSNLVKLFIAIILWIGISLLAASNFMWYFVPPEDFFLYLQEPTQHLFLFSFVLSLASFLVYDIILLKENFCTYVCPYSRTQNVLYDEDTKHVIYDTNRGGSVYENAKKSVLNIDQWVNNEECTTCEACVKVCPTHIDIRKGLQLECINCLECSDACASVMGKLQKKSLINWQSTNALHNKINSNYFSKRNITYFVSVVATLMLGILFAYEKEPLLINVNKTTQLYTIQKDSQVYNGYVLAVHNTQNKTYTYDVKLENNETFYVKNFKSFELEPNRRVKKILIIQTKKRLHLSHTQDSVLKLTLKVFAKQDPKIQTKQEIAFIYPKEELFK